MKQALRLITILILFSATSGRISSSASNEKKHYQTRPRLALVITINGLQGYQLENFLPLMDDGGLRRIVDNGVYSGGADCTYMPYHSVADYASLMTGSVPRMHGIVADQFYSMLDDRQVSSIADARYDGINTQLNVSPRLLQANTITDQLKIAFPESKVYSIALSAESAIMLGGHLADGAVWIDDSNGLAATSTYYNNGLPLWASRMNNDQHLAEMRYQEWTTLKDAVNYRHSFTEERQGFRPVLNQISNNSSASDKIRYMKQTPVINEIIKELAIHAIIDERLGNDDNPDLLSVEFNVNNRYSSTPMSAENEDMFARLDRNIKQLLDAIETAVGLDNCVIVLTAPHHYRSGNEQKNDRLNQGSFNSYRATALLNAYLMAIYGQGRWVTGYYNKNINLNKKLIEDNNILLNEIEDRASQFMLEFAGVHSSYSAIRLQTAGSLPGDYPARLRNSHFKNRSGDVVFTLLPGWGETGKNDQILTSPTTTQNRVPVAFWFDGIKQTSEPFWFEDICPTLCHLLQIPAPNACIGSIINIQK